MSKLGERIKDEVLEVLPPTIFFFIAFHLLTLFRALMLRQYGEEIVWPYFWAIQLWLLVLLFVYCAVRELVRVIGPHEVKRMFFGPVSDPA